ncbi:MAG: hypothetical protein OEV44_00835 [Spirochaetota bacterium]|nr:hypothetical protein [Spirochaetota bacterium]
MNKENKKKYAMYKGTFGFMDYIGTYETQNIKDMDHKVLTGEIDYYYFIEEE